MRALIARYTPFLVGVLLIYAGVSKLIHPAQAVYALESLDIPQWIARASVGSLTVVEMYFGILSFIRSEVRYVLVGVGVLMFGFTVFLWYLTTLANPPSCGCMGLTGMFSSNRQAAFWGLVRNCLILWCLKVSYDYHFHTLKNEAEAVPIQTHD